MDVTRVLIIDDHPFFRCGLADWLNQQSQFACCGEVGSYAAARGAIEQKKPEVVLIDLQLGDGDGLDLVSEVSAHSKTTRFIVLSQRDESTYAHRALKAGARGYVMKSEATEKVLLALETVVRGEIFVSRSVSARLLHNLFPDPANLEGGLNLLTDRELQVFQLLGSGCKIKEIGSILKISSKTVETYRENIKEKLALPHSEGVKGAAESWVNTGVLNFEGARIR